MAVLIDGKKVAADVCAQVAEKAVLLPRKPSLAAILVGSDPASQIYVRNKELDCAKCGFDSVLYTLPDTIPEQELLTVIDELNHDDRIDGILCQLPLPSHIRESAVIDAISPAKDVDAFHPVNVGRMVTGQPAFQPCTPSGIMELLRAYDISPEGKVCVVVGRSNIVGKPMAMLLLHANGTVICCHSRTPDLAEKTRMADILVCAVGHRGLITADMVKPGAVVIDVAMNRDPGTGKLCGDVCFEEVREKASFITPVPGGVGPMTRAMLMKNILTASEQAQQRI